MTRVDWVAAAIVVLGALSGLRRGLVATALSLGGLIAGALIGARIAPHLLHGGADSPYTPLAGLVGALVGASLLQWAASVAGSFARGGLSVIPPLRFLDSVGGFVVGAGLGLALVWVAGAALLLIPGESRLRTEVQQSTILHRLNEVAPPRTVLRALARVDPFPQIAGPAPPTTPPDSRVLRSAGGARGPSQRRSDHCGRMRLRRRGLGLGGAAAHRRHSGPRRRRRQRHPGERPRGDGARRRPEAGRRRAARPRPQVAAAAASSMPMPAIPSRSSATRSTARSMRDRAGSATPPTCSSRARCAR